MLRPEITVEVLNRRSAGNLPALIGIEITGVTEPALTGRLAVRSQLLAANGYLHAASVIALADTLCGYGTFAHLPQGAKGFTTIELKSNFLGTARVGTILCTATPVHLGRSTHIWDAVVSDEASTRKIALFRCTQLILMR